MPSPIFFSIAFFLMFITKFNVNYLIKLHWQSYRCRSLKLLEVGACLLGTPFSIPISLKKLRVYILKSAHAQNTSAECLESHTWVGKSQSFFLSSAARFLNSCLLQNEGVAFRKLACCLEFSRFRSFKLFFY